MEQRKRIGRNIQWSIAGGIAFLLLVFPFLSPKPFPQHVMIMVFLYAGLGQAWNILGGFAGQISLGHTMFFGIGAYTSTLLLIWLAVNPWIGMVGGVFTALILSQVIGYPCFKLKGHYFAIATICVGEILNILFINWDKVGGAVGLYIPMLEESILNFEFHSSKVPYYYIGLGLFGLSLVASYGIKYSRLGYYFRAIKEEQDAAMSLGINAARYKLVAIGISASLTAMMGTFYAQYVLFIDPFSVFPLLLSIQICLIAVLGGSGTILGPMLGSIVLIPMSEYTRVWLGGGGRGVDMIVYGALIMVISVYKPRGLMGLFTEE